MIRSLFSRAEKPAIRGVHLYFSPERVIVAPLHQNLAGLYHEQATPLVLEGTPRPQEIGAAFQRAFEDFSIRDEDLRNARRSDWPAYQVSGVRSLKAFESAFKPMQCHGLNPSNAVVRASMQHPQHEGIDLSISFNPLLDAHAVGEKLLQLARAAGAA